jgi:hypothetical protein
LICGTFSAGIDSPQFSSSFHSGKIVSILIILPVVEGNDICFSGSGSVRETAYNNNIQF